MGRLLVIIPGIGILISCLINNEGSVDNITRISVFTKSPVRIINNQPESLVIEFYISYFGKYRVYELPYHKTYQINDKLIYDSIKYEYFIYNTNENTGYLLKRTSDTFRTRICSDSILKARAYGGVSDIVDLSRGVKIKTIDERRDKGKIFFCRYLFENDFYDSAYFYYNKDFGDIEFSLSKTLDSTYASKLVKADFFIRHTNNEGKSGLENFYVNTIEIRKVPSENPDEIKNLITRFIANEKNYRD